MMVWLNYSGNLATLRVKCKMYLHAQVVVMTNLIFVGSGSSSESRETTRVWLAHVCAIFGSFFIGISSASKLNS